MTPIDTSTCHLIECILVRALQLFPSITNNPDSWEKVRGYPTKEVRVGAGWSKTIAVEQLISFSMELSAEIELTSKVGTAWNSGMIEIKFLDNIHRNNPQKFFWSLEGDKLSMHKLPPT